MQRGRTKEDKRTPIKADRGPSGKEKNRQAYVEGSKAKREQTVKQRRDPVGSAVEADEQWGATPVAQAGKWTADVTVRTRSSFKGQRRRQVLRHVSTAVFHLAKEKVSAEQEVQAMYVNKRLFLSANEPASMPKLSADQLVRLLDSTNAPVGRGKRSADKLNALVKGQRIETIAFEDEEERDEVAAIAEIIREVVQHPDTAVTHCTVEDARNFVDDAEHESHLILVEGLAGLHAEQNLVIAYCKSGSAAPALIYGKKRPCTGCFMTLAYARTKLGKNLTYNQNPGGYWKKADAGLMELSQIDKNLELEDVHKFATEHLPKMTYRSAKAGTVGVEHTKARSHLKGEDKGYDTESDTEDD